MVNKFVDAGALFSATMLQLATDAYIDTDMNIVGDETIKYLRMIRISRQGRVSISLSSRLLIPYSMRYLKVNK